MFSSKDFEKCWFLYQSEGLPHNLSIEEFCLKQGVPVNEFNKWFKTTHKRIHPVHVDGMPEVRSDVSASSEPASGVRIAVTICTTSGLYVKRKNLNYENLVSFVEKLEGLC